MGLTIIFDGLYLEVTAPTGVPEDLGIITKYRTLADGSISVQSATTTALNTIFSGVCPKSNPDGGSATQATIDRILARIGLLRTLSINGRPYGTCCISKFDYSRSGEIWSYIIGFEQKTSLCSVV
jgi:hypothetical protein